MTDSFVRMGVKPGWIEVITGSMFSGKSEELIRRIRRSELANLRYKVFKPKLDDRYSKDCVASHNNNKVSSIVIEDPIEIIRHIDQYTQVVGIDEAQFMTPTLIEVARELADSGKRVIIAGLDTDWQGRPFGPMPQLMAVAEIVDKQHAICMVCGEPASRTQRLVADSGDILVGSTESYEARCRRHFDPDLSLRMAQKPLAQEAQSNPTP